MLIFEYIKWKNLLSTGDVYTEINLNRKGTTLIEGLNGDGKSTILDALAFGLYNKPFRDINKPDLVNRINNKNTVVEIAFEVGRSNYKIIRGIKPNIFQIYKDGELLNQEANSRDPQEHLEKNILKMNMKAFFQVVVLGSSSYTHFMKLTPGERRAVIEDLLDIQVFSKMNTNLKPKTAQNELDLSENNKNIEIINTKISVQRKYEEDIKKDYSEKISSLKDENIELENRIEIVKGNIAELSSEVSTLSSDANEKSKLMKKMSEFSNIQGELTQKTKDLDKDIKFLESTDICPTCKQNIHEEFRCETVNTKKKSKGEMVEGLEKLKKILENTSSKIEGISRIQSTINSLNIKIATENTNLTNISGQISRNLGQISTLENKKVEKVDSSLDLHEEEFEKLQLKRSELLNEKDALSVCVQILKDMGIKSKTVKQYIPTINKLINRYLADMDFYISFELDETFKESINTSSKEVNSYFSFSEGEKMRINLAILFAWREIVKLKNSAACNLLILDEILDGSLDEYGIEDFMKIIKKVFPDTATFIISHRGNQIRDNFLNTIKFVKKNNFSIVVSEERS